MTPGQAMVAEPAQDSAVRLRSVAFAYPGGPAILDLDALHIGRGGRVFLHGPSGSGKTTLLSLISGVLQPRAGSVEVLGRDLARLSASARDTLRGARMGYIFQGFNLIPYLSVEENIVLPCQLHPSRKERITAPTLAEEAARLVQRLDLHAHLNSPVTRLSVGQQQRVAIARAVIGKPELLIADEPTSSLDTDRRDSFLRLLLEVTEEAGATLLFVSHDRSLATHFDRTLSLQELNRATHAQAAA